MREFVFHQTQFAGQTLEHRVAIDIDLGIALPQLGQSDPSTLHAELQFGDLRLLLVRDHGFAARDRLVDCRLARACGDKGLLCLVQRIVQPLELGEAAVLAPLQADDIVGLAKRLQFGARRINAGLQLQLLIFQFGSGAAGRGVDLLGAEFLVGLGPAIDQPLQSLGILAFGAQFEEVGLGHRHHRQQTAKLVHAGDFVAFGGQAP